MVRASSVVHRVESQHFGDPALAWSGTVLCSNGYVGGAHSVEQRTFLEQKEGLLR